MFRNTLICSTSMARATIRFIHSPYLVYEQNQGVRFAPVWAYTLAAYVPEAWTASVFDCTLDPVGAIDDADVFAFSGINQDLPSILETHAALKRRFPNAIFILGGPIVWSFEQDGRLDALSGFDHLFVLDGEASLPNFLNALSASGRAGMPKVIRADRFPIEAARPMRFDLLRPQASRYYGAVVEVARGCPFLCEFCDIRVLPQNNETHSKDPRLIVDELDAYASMGIRQIQLACDNFIGDQVWANQCVDAILDWQARTGQKVALYTWLTVNLSRLPDLMAKMRRAGFTAVFIGVESFNANSILETAKVQNRNEARQMVEALREIQARGFLVIPGLIFGFDSDRPSLFDDTLNGVLESGLLGGDPTFLIALPGTPLHARMKRTGRLIEHRDDTTLALHEERVSKVESNIRYLQPREFLIAGFMDFVRRFTDAGYMRRRFVTHVAIMRDQRFVPDHALGYGSLPEYLKFQLSSAGNFGRMVKRGALFLRPDRLYTVLVGLWLVWRHRRTIPGLRHHFSIWVFLWSNLLLKYAGLTAADFKIQSVSASEMDAIWRDLETHTPSGVTTPDGIKVGAQEQRTHQALTALKARLSSEYSLSDFRKS
ncbi:MAG: radical SAM protein [Acidobacteria bacterium]|nr:MAG: radical SAM protein [Acidobacteriota bacterium]